ncbi:hypothetical protein AAZX31_15G202400 [Glycine max]
MPTKYTKRNPKSSILDPKPTISSTSALITPALTAFTLFSFATKHSVYHIVATFFFPRNPPPSRSFTRCRIATALPIIASSSSLFCDNRTNTHTAFSFASFVFIVSFSSTATSVFTAPQECTVATDGGGGRHERICRREWEMRCRQGEQ